MGISKELYTIVQTALPRPCPSKFDQETPSRLYHLDPLIDSNKMAGQVAELTLDPGKLFFPLSAGLLQHFADEVTRRSLSLDLYSYS